jgi:hypothetical protein
VLPDVSPFAQLGLIGSFTGQHYLHGVKSALTPRSRSGADISSHGAGSALRSDRVWFD